MSDKLKYVRVGMRRNGASVKLKLRWDNSPHTCRIICDSLPFEGDMWHAKYANHEIYTSVACRGDIWKGPAEGMALHVPSTWRPHVYFSPGRASPA